MNAMRRIVAVFNLLEKRVLQARRTFVLVLSAGIILVTVLCVFVPAQVNTLSPHVALISAGMNAEDTAHLDEAILLYRQTVDTPTSPRIFAAFAQFSLGQIFLRKGDMNTATLEFDKLARDYKDCSDLVRTLVAESHTNIFNGLPSKDSAMPIGFIRDGSYHHNSTGFEVSMQGWALIGGGHTSGGGDTIYLRDPYSDTRISIWLKADHLSADEIPNRLRGALLQKLLQRLALENYKVRPESAQMLNIGDKQALSAVADYHQQGVGMAECLTWIYTEKTRVLFFARTTEPDLRRLKPIFDQLIATASVP